MNWEQKGSYATVAEIVTAKSGLSEEELLNPSPIASNTIKNLETAAHVIKEAIDAHHQINIMGDYDVDGITSSAILHFLVNKMGGNPYVRLPRRMSEGYGLKTSTVDEFKAGLLITVDNGIAANEAIQVAKDKGLTVVILDHHLPQDELPCADVIVDPHVSPNDNGFVDYCGAGLAYKLCQLIYPHENDFLMLMEELATIGTIADSMPLIGDNRYIVKNGLKNLKEGKILLPGIKALLNEAEIYDIDEYDIGFKIGPMLNAAGRLRDDGAMLSFKAVTAATSTAASKLVKELKTLNEERKTLTASAEQNVEKIIQEECMYYDAPMCILAEDIPEGIVGIITGRIAEKYKTPTFILTTTETPGLYKGSGRSYGDYNLLTAVNAAMPYLAAGGGHAGAAGISVREENYVDMVNAMRDAMEAYEAPDNEVLEYDLEISAPDVFKALEEVKKYAPYGQHNPKPVFLIKDVLLSPRNGATVKYMGKSMEHVKLLSRGFSAICFGASETYRKQGCPINLDIVGCLSMNVFRYASELQIEGIEFRPHIATAKTSKPTSLLDAIKRNGTI